MIDTKHTVHMLISSFCNASRSQALLSIYRAWESYMVTVDLLAFNLNKLESMQKYALARQQCAKHRCRQPVNSD